MQTTRSNQYLVTVKKLDASTPNVLKFNYQDREDLFNTVEKIKQGSGLSDEQAEQLTLAIRLMGPLMMKDRKHPLFNEFFPHFKDFMQHLKNTVKQKQLGI